MFVQLKLDDVLGPVQLTRTALIGNASTDGKWIMLCRSQQQRVVRVSKALL